MGKKAKGKKKGRRRSSGSSSPIPAHAGRPPDTAAGAPLVAADRVAAFMPSDGRDALPAAELAARLAGLSALLQRNLSRTDADDGLTRARLSALGLIVLGGPRTLGDLAAAERVRPPTMTRLVQAMEADGLVAREPNPVDGRSVIIRATPDGEQALELGRARRMTPLAEGIAQLPGEERRQLEAAADLIDRLLRDSTWESTGSPE